MQGIPPNSLVFLFSHPFLNKLISFDFTPTEQEEAIDYFISFLKMISLSLSERPHLLQFFFNDRFKDFPLFGAAIRLYNYQESMVRTAVRTITLNIFNLLTPEMCKVILSLPNAVYFPNLACQLRDRWIACDQMIVNHDIDINDLRDECDDIQELLMYFQDVFQLKIPPLTKALTNSLIYYAYFPMILHSINPVST